MNDKGYIKLYRKTLDNPIVTKDNDYFRLWIQLLLMANYKESKVLFGNDIKELKKGQLITGRDELAKKCNISSSKVERILKKFKNEQQIEQQTCSKGRLISIVNWEQYHVNEQQIEQQVNNEWTTSEQQVNTIKKRKNNKNIKNNRKSNEKEFIKPTLKEVQEYCISRNNGINAQKFIDFYDTNGWVQGKNKPIKDWKACIRTWEKSDNLPEWFNKKVKSEPLSKQEIAEMNELLKKF